MKLQLAILTPILFVTPAFAQSPEAPTSSSATSHKDSGSVDAFFVKKLAQGDLAEIDAGRLASQKASDEGVRRFGEQMVGDHSKNNTELETLARSHGIQIPTTIDQEHAAAKAKLDAASNSTFDSEYVKAQVRDHEKTVQLLEHEIQNGEEGAMKEFAQKTLPVVKHHLAMAKQLQGELPKAVAERSRQ